MAKSVIEIETKYDAPEGVSLPRFEGVAGVSQVSAPREDRLEAEYFDTDGLRLLRAGVTLRRRHGGPDAGWHLKLPVSGAGRREIQLPISTGTVPEELSDLVQGIARGEPLRPVARIETRRQVLALRGESGDSLAEVADDEVSAQTMGTSTAISRWREIEVELTGGDQGLLEKAGRVLRRAGMRPAAGTAKLERALGVPADQHATAPAAQSPAQTPTAQTPTAQSPAAQTLTDKATAADVLLAYLRAQSQALVALDPQVRRGEPDAVHQMRVAARRLRSTLQAFRGVLRRDGTRPIQAELRWLGAQLGTARDNEVLAARLAHGIRQTPVEQLIGPVQADVTRHFAAGAQAAHETVLTTLRSARYFRLLDDLDALLAGPPLTPAGARPGRKVLPREAARAYRRTARRMRRALRAPAGPPRDIALHEARKAAKRARYAGEAVTPVIGKPAKRFAKRMKKVQSALGEHQDTVIARKLDRDLGVRAHLAGENAFTYGLLYESEACQARELQAQAARTWKRASRRSTRRWLP